MEFGFEVFGNSILLMIIGSKSRNVIVFLRFFQNTFQNGAKPIPNQGVLRKNRKYCVLPFLKAKRSVFLRGIRRIYALVQKSEQHEGRSFEKTSFVF